MGLYCLAPSVFPGDTRPWRMVPWAWRAPRRGARPLLEVAAPNRKQRRAPGRAAVRSNQGFSAGLACLPAAKKARRRSKFRASPGFFCGGEAGQACGKTLIAAHSRPPRRAPLLPIRRRHLQQRPRASPGRSPRPGHHPPRPRIPRENRRCQAIQTHCQGEKCGEQGRPAPGFLKKSDHRAKLLSSGDAFTARPQQPGVCPGQVSAEALSRRGLHRTR